MIRSDVYGSAGTAARSRHHRAGAVRALLFILALVLSTLVVQPAAADTAATTPVPPVCRTVGYDHTCIYDPLPDVAPVDRLREFVVPAGVSEVTFDVRGGQGGSSWFYSGGRGGRAIGTFDVTPGERYLIAVGHRAQGPEPGFPDGGAPGRSESSDFAPAGAGGGTSLVVHGATDATLLFAGGGGGTGGGIGGKGGDAGQDGEHGQHQHPYIDEDGKEATHSTGERGWGGYTPWHLEGARFRFWGGGSGGVGCPAGDDGVRATDLRGGTGGAGAYGGGGGGGMGGSGGGGSGRVCPHHTATATGGGGGGGARYVAEVARDRSIGRNPVFEGRVIVTYTVAEGTVGARAPETFLLWPTPPAVDTDLTPRFTFAGSDDTSVVGYECQLNGSAFATCSSGHRVTVTPGQHTFRVRAVDGEGNVDPTPATHTWTVREMATAELHLSLHPDQPAVTNKFGLRADSQLSDDLRFIARTDPAFSFQGAAARSQDRCLPDQIEVNGRPNVGFYGPGTMFFHFESSSQLEPGLWSVALGEGTVYRAPSGTYRIRFLEGCFRDANRDPSAASNEVTIVLDFTPPETILTAGPDPQRRTGPFSFEFEGTDEHSSVESFQCRLDAGAFTPCTSPTFYEDLPPGTRFQVRAVDAAGNIDPTPATFLLPANSPPTAAAGPDVSGDEGSPIHLAGSVSDPDPGDDPTARWSVEDGVPCEFDDPAAAETTITCSDDGVFEATLTADDGDATASDTVTVTVANVAPTVGTIAGPVDPVAKGTAVSVSAPFTDPGTDDTHTCEIDWGDGTAPEAIGAVTDTCRGSRTYAAPGIYTVTVTVTDDDGDAGTGSYEYAVVYDPDAGFVTGGGWIDSPAGAYRNGGSADHEVTGRAQFGFVSRYKKGAKVPDGDTQFQFRAADLDFRSTAYEWLVISGPRAQYKGVGTIDGTGNYGFLLTATDGQRTGGGGVDRFRIKIWDKDRGDTVVYDNQRGDADGGDATQALGGGSIVIHDGKKR